MKTTYLILALIASTFIFGCNFNNSGQSISISNNESSYNFKASYPERKTAKVLACIENTLKEDKIFSTPEGRKDSDITLGDSIKFHLKAEPGFIEINFNKQNNSFPAYHKMEKLCLGIKEVLR